MILSTASAPALRRFLAVVNACVLSLTSSSSFITMAARFTSSESEGQRSEVSQQPQVLSAACRCQVLPCLEYPVAVMMGTATITRPEALHTYFIRNCSNITYQSLFSRI